MTAITGEKISRAINPLSLQVMTIIIGSALIIAATIVTSSISQDRSNRAQTYASAALIAAELDTTLHRAREGIQLMGDLGQLDVAVLLATNEELELVVAESQELVSLVSNEDTLALLAHAEEAQENASLFFISRSESDQAHVLEDLDLLDEQLQPLSAQLRAESTVDHRDSRSAVSSAKTIVIATAAIVTLMVTLFSVVVGRRLARSLAETRDERDNLSEMTRVISKRNEQFNALYQVVSEVTDSLSMRYVVNTTVSEALRLVNADYVELRLIEGEHLTLAGNTAVDESLANRGDPLPLGVGMAGRAAKRGKNLRVDYDGAESMAEGERVEGVESGVVVPLIVGAKVVGVLSCWSKAQRRFDTDDERILELMAAQVASAVAAADLHESSERRASHDALTGLPNRRQLLEDSPSLAEELSAGELFGIVMLDVDHFKRFNDDFGHRVGDVTLQRVASVMRGSIRESDTIYRYGGEEFLIVLRDVEEYEATQLVERLRENVGKTLLTGENLEPVGPVTVSAGVSLAPLHSSDLTTLIRLADAALYVSKQTGRNRVTVSQQPPLSVAA